MNEKIEAVQKMQDYIEMHLFEDISMTNLANASLFSPWYARRLFLELLNISPSDYIRKLRLKKAALMLRDEKIKIIDVAYLCGFNSVDGFQRAFYKEFNTNPKEYANNPKPIKLFTSYGIKYSNVERKVKNMSAKSVFISVIEKDERKVIIKRAKTAKEYFTYCSEVGCDVWGILLSIKSISNEPVCLWLPKKYIKENTSEYVQGVEVALDYNGEIPEGFDVITLPKAKYLMFQGEPFKEEDFEKAISDIWAAEKKYNPEILGYKWDEENPRIQLEPIGNRGYIELLAIK